jgi:hypothetical protein
MGNGRADKGAAITESVAAADSETSIAGLSGEFDVMLALHDEHGFQHALRRRA